ncbi:MAG TPA: isoprenylcysteine carboxylmethyltransferase family protein [Rhodothermales bacterium]|nr:isoprenylcysteine carboxylmethyltransferase family protein [Rhodothermales bacterium]
MGYLWTGFRAAVYATAFFAGWYYVAISVQPLDSLIGLRPPKWIFLLGLWIVGLGGILALVCVSTFVHRGRGTPAPFDPPRKFVAAGPYRVVRNPMYIGGLMVFLGFGMVERSVAIMLLAVIVSMGFHFFVVLVEEPVLERRFGDSYRRYKQSVGRWIPRRQPGDDVDLIESRSEESSGEAQ